MTDKSKAYLVAELQHIITNRLINYMDDPLNKVHPPRELFNKAVESVTDNLEALFEHHLESKFLSAHLKINGEINKLREKNEDLHKQLEAKKLECMSLMANHKQPEFPKSIEIDLSASTKRVLLLAGICNSKHTTKEDISTIIKLANQFHEGK